MGEGAFLSVLLIGGTGLSVLPWVGEGGILSAICIRGDRSVGLEKPLEHHVGLLSICVWLCPCLWR